MIAEEEIRALLVPGSVVTYEGRWRSQILQIEEEFGTRVIVGSNWHPPVNGWRQPRWDYAYMVTVLQTQSDWSIQPAPADLTAGLALSLTPVARADVP